MKRYLDMYAYVDTSELDRALESIGKFDGKTRLAVEDALRKGVKRICRAAKQRVPVKTGELKKHFTTSFNAKELAGEVKVKWPTAHLVELGTKPHTIKPKNKKFLEFTVNGKKIYTKGVIVSAKPHPYLKPAFDEGYPDIVRDCKRAVIKSE